MYFLHVLGSYNVYVVASHLVCASVTKRYRHCVYIVMHKDKQKLQVAFLSLYVCFHHFKHSLDEHVSYINSCFWSSQQWNPTIVMCQLPWWFPYIRFSRCNHDTSYHLLNHPCPKNVHTLLVNIWWMVCCLRTFFGWASTDMRILSAAVLS